MGPRMDPINGGVRAGRITCRLSKWGRGPHRLSKWDPEVDTSPRGVSSRRITCRSYRLSVGGPRSRAPADTLGVARGLEVLDAGSRLVLKTAKETGRKSLAASVRLSVRPIVVVGT